VNGAALAKLQAEEKPAVQQLAEALQQREGRFTLYSWEESRVLRYLRVGFPQQPILTYALFEEQTRIKPEETALLTDHVLMGFQQQGIPIDGKVKPLAEFVSNPLFEPVYWHITLYEWR